MLVHTNREATTESAQATIAALKQAAQEKEMTFLDGRTYVLTQGEDEQINIEFIP